MGKRKESAYEKKMALDLYLSRDCGVFCKGRVLQGRKLRRRAARALQPSTRQRLSGLFFFELFDAMEGRQRL